MMKLIENKLIDDVLNGDQNSALSHYKKLISTYECTTNTGCKLRSLKSYLICINCILYKLCDENEVLKKEIFEKRNSFIVEIDNTNSFKCLYNLGKEIISFYININKDKYSHTSHPIVNQALHYIHSNLDKNLTLEEVAKEIHISKSHLCNLFPIYVKSSFSCYVNNTKIEYGKKLLSNTSKSLVDIAFECGFNSQSYFCSTFKKFERITPLQYRKKILK